MRLPFPLSLLSFVALLSFAPGASSQEVIAAAMHGVPISAEPDHHQVLSNDYVNAYDVEVPPKSATLMHQHLYDNIFVVLGAADITNSVEGKGPAHLRLIESTVNFGRAPYAQLLTNNGTKPFRNVIIEFVQPQGEVKDFYKSVGDALTAAATDESGVKQNAVLETDAVRVLGIGIPINGAWVAPSDGQARLVVLLDDASSATKRKKDSSPSLVGALVWLEENSEGNGIANESARPLRLVVVEFKQSQGQATARL
jgi:hypothetical protein